MALCPRGHDKAVVGLASNGRCKQCHREDHRAYKRRAAAKRREREKWANSPYRRMRHKTTNFLCRLRHRITRKRAAIERLESELVELREDKHA